MEPATPKVKKKQLSLLSLPPELVVQILRYTLPRTISLGDLPPYKYKNRASSNIDDRWYTLWLRGNTSVLCACRVLHELGMKILYGESTFALDVHFDRIEFAYQWVLPTRAPYPLTPDPESVTKRRKDNEDYFSSASRTVTSENGQGGAGPRAYSHYLTPRQHYDFLSKFSPEIRGLMQRFVFKIWEPDGYWGWIYHSISNETRLAMGLREQIYQALMPRTSCSIRRRIPTTILKSLGRSEEQQGPIAEGSSEVDVEGKKDFVGIILVDKERHSPQEDLKIEGLKLRDWVVQPAKQLSRTIAFHDDRPKPKTGGDLSREQFLRAFAIEMDLKR